jgi:CDP-paratose 2-epimerase
MKILVTGGAGFVGCALSKHLAHADRKHEVVVFDNLRRRGSEKNIDNLRAVGISFVHGDVRNSSDLEALAGSFDMLVEASAEPSVSAGIGDSPRYVLDTNLSGAVNCLEYARKNCGGVIFLSTSRVYSIEPLRQLPLSSLQSRLDFLDDGCPLPGVSSAGISERFPCDSTRSYYGASKLAAEMICQEYSAHAALPVVINRCAAIAGPGQFGKVDQGVFTLWVARHLFGRSLKYTGFGGKGLQVRDLLHPLDLCELIDLQIQSMDRISGRTFNVGGGRAGSVSLQEFTVICRQVTGCEVPVAEEQSTSTVDIPWYVTDHSKVTDFLGWAPQRSPLQIAEDIAQWIRANETGLKDTIV